MFWPFILSFAALTEAPPIPLTPGIQRASFTLCPNGGAPTCVVDGDTFRLFGHRVRMADIDAPETHGPKCAAEAALGKAATLRLHALLNAGPFALNAGPRDTDRYGRALRTVSRGGVSIGDVLVSEGLARRYSGGRRQPWCGAG